MPLDYEDIKMEGWLYMSNYPLFIKDYKATNGYNFFIRLYEWNSHCQSLELKLFEYQSTSSNQTVYVPNNNYSKSLNQTGETLIDNDLFQKNIQPVIITGFRDVAIRMLNNET